MAIITVSPEPVPPTPGPTTQETINLFWAKNLTPETPSTRPPTVLPHNVLVQLVGESMPHGDIEGQSVTVSYEQAVKDCVAKVAAIVAECRRNNQKYSDPHFDLDDMGHCLESLGTNGDPSTDGDGAPPPRVLPACSKRVGDIFDDPKFFVDRNAYVKAIQQGSEGDCWFLASLGCLAVDKQFPALIEKLCPERARDEKVGVYGFVFYRDGEWISEIIDDKLYLKAPDYDDCTDERRSVLEQAHNRIDPDAPREEYRKSFQRNSDSLFYGSCANPNETWVPLIEKAFAKAHGDYNAIDGGVPGEGVEDLTGGVTTEILSADILDKDELWTESFLKVNTQFLINAGTRSYGNQESSGGARQGIEDQHAYSLIKAVEYKGNRLCLVRNPWGHTEWNGPWSDGSKEWTAEALTDLAHNFDNEGIFWMPYADFLRRYYFIYRTRLFTDEWNVTQKWTTVQVPWAGQYQSTKFQFVLPKPCRTVVVLSQLDASYYCGLSGQYAFQLAFRLHKKGEQVHIVRGYSSGERSATNEADLEAGTYEVLMQISATRDSSKPRIDDVVAQNWLDRREKLITIGKSYDLANAKGQPRQLEPTAATPVASGGVAAPSNPTVSSQDQQQPLPAAVRLQSTAQIDPNSMDASAADIITTLTMQASDDQPPDNPEPWDAVCVVGLRLLCSGTAATIRVVNVDAGAAGTVKSVTKLDIDDPEKDATKGLLV